VVNTKNVDSKEIQTFIEDVRDDLKNIDDIINYYDFLGHHNIRSIVFNPENDSSFFAPSALPLLAPRPLAFFLPPFPSEIDERTRIDVLEIIRTYLPHIRKKLDG